MHLWGDILITANFQKLASGTPNVEWGGGGGMLGGRGL